MGLTLERNAASSDLAGRTLLRHHLTTDAMTFSYDRLPRILLLVALCSAPAVCQQISGPPPDEVLARVGTRVITAREFIRRVDLMPWIGKEKRGSTDAVKLRALRSMVAEKLFAQEAEEQGMVNDARILAMVGALRRALARDHLYREEVVNKTRVPESEIQKGLRRSWWQLRVQGYAFPGEEQAKAFALACADTAHPDSIIASSLNPASRVTDTLVVSYGSLDQPYEDALFALERPGMTPQVFSRKEGWAVFRLLEKRTNPARSIQSLPEARLFVEKKARNRLEEVRAQEFLLGFEPGEPLHQDSAMFAAVADTVVAFLRQDTLDRHAGVVNQVDRLREAFASRLQETFATGPRRTWTLEEILESLRFYPVRFPEGTSPRSITYALNRLMMLAIEGEELSSEGMARGYDRVPEVRADVRTWEEALLALADARQVERSVPGAASPDTAAAGTQGAQQQRRERLAVLQRHLQDLARRYGVELFPEKLARIVINSFSMVTKRNIGFGGTMTAVPALSPEWEWISGADDRNRPPP